MTVFEVSDDLWRAYPGAAAGFLILRDVDNPETCPALDRPKTELETTLRVRYQGQEPAVLQELPVIRAYNRYYKGFKKTYHVTAQLESIVWKNKPFPHGAALVEAMFMAELQHLLLTAGHDLDTLVPPVQVGISRGIEEYTVMRGTIETLKEGDMYMADRLGIISSILYGPDQRTRLTPTTRNALFAVYAPPGIPESRVYDHLRSIQYNVEQVSPNAKVDRLVILSA